MPSHPPSLLTLARRLCKDERLLERGTTIVCACSGGPDSTAMLHVLARMRDKMGHRLVAVGVDHGLRPEAAAELALVESLARAEDVPFEAVRLQLEPGPDLQARARRARYAALRAAAERATAARIAVGHTADDRAETLVMRLLRGAGPRGLAVMPPCAPFPFDQFASQDGDDAVPGPPLVRPLLLARRSDVLAHLRRHRLRWADDPSNLDRRFLRVRVRHEVMPLLEELSPRIVEHLCALAGMLADSGGADPLAGLGRAQRLAIQRALRLGRRSTTVRVSGGRDVELGLSRDERDEGP